VDDQMMNIYTLTIYIIHGPFCDIMLNHDFWPDVGCDFIYVINVILVVNVGCNYFIATNWNCKLKFFFQMYKPLDICPKCEAY